MDNNNSFLNSIKNVTDSKIEEKINNGDPYDICDVLEETSGGANGVYLKELEDAIVNTKDIVQIYEFLFMAVDMKIKGFDQERFEEIIRNSNMPKLMCYSMGFVPGINIEKMLEALKETKNAKYMELLLNDEEYSEVLEEINKIEPNYEEEVEEAKQFDYYPKSLEQFINFKDDIEKLKEEVIKTNNPHFITELANYIEYLNEYKGKEYDISDLTLAQEEIKDPMQSYEYLASVNVEDRSGLINAVIDSNKVKFMYYVYEYVPGLLEEEKDILKKSIIDKDKKGKYKKMVESGDSEIADNSDITIKGE